MLLTHLGAAHAQSGPTLEAVRLRRPTALSLSQEELARCRKGGTDGGTRACDRLPQLALLVGYLALSEGDAAAALQTLQRSAPPPGLEAFHLYYLGQAQFYGAQPGLAAKSFELALKTAPAWLAPRVRARLGEAWLAAGDPAQAAPLLEKAALEMGQPELFWERAQARRLVGNVNGEQADLRTLALRFPAHPYGRAAMDTLSPARRPLVLSLDERLQRARGLLDAADPSGALAELETAERQKVARGASANARLALLRAQALFAAGDEARGLRAVDDARKGQPSVAAEALMLRARRALKGTDRSAAITLFQEVDKSYPREPSADDAAFLAAWLYAQEQRYPEAIAAFDEFERRHAGSRKRDEALWWKGFTELRAGKLPDARASFERLASAFPRSSLVPQARYWAARSQQLSLPPGPAPAELVAAFQSVLSLYPGTLYGLFARERLGELGTAVAHPFAVSPRALGGTLPDELRLATALAGVGLFPDAADEAQARLQGVRTAQEALRFGHALQAIGDFGAAHALAVRLLWGPAYVARQPEALALMYPRAWAQTVEKEAREQDLDPFLVWSIMRRESAFRPEVLSNANARGLMQIMPATGTSIARELGQPPPDADELFSPELSIRLGAWYLSALMTRFGHPSLCAAAYNAGPTPTLRWLAQAADLPMDLWIEQIPFKETRGYVKQVTADYYLYHALYDRSEKPPRPRMDIPPPLDAGVEF